MTESKECYMNVCAKALLALIVATSLAACGTMGKSGKKGQPVVEERPTEAQVQVQEQPSESFAAPEQPGFSGSPLDDPNSLLSKRVIYFEFDSSIIQEEYSPIIEAHAAYLVDHPNARITLEGHADERGTREYNMALGERRAKAVRQYMSLQGVSPDQMDVISFGEERPVALGHDEESWHLNRRVEIIYNSR